MSDFQKGDVCSLEVTVTGVLSAGPTVRVDGGNLDFQVWSKDLTLLRRAPVDLATCELPVEVSVPDHNGRYPSTLIARDEDTGWLKDSSGMRRAYALAELRPLDAPAPAPDQSGMAAENERRRIAILTEAVDPGELTLLRRAPVDLATCELPVEVEDLGGKKGTAIARCKDGETLIVEAGPILCKAPIKFFRPLDAPAPAPTLEGIKSDLVSQQKIFDPRIEKAIFDNLDTLYEDAPTPAPDQSDMAAENERLRGFVRWAAKQAVRTDCSAEVLIRGLKVMVDRTTLASTAPACAEKVSTIENISLPYVAPAPASSEWATRNGKPVVGCPPGHIMIGDRAVPEPMRDEPREDAAIWLANTTGVQQLLYSGNGAIRQWLLCGILHSTEDAARAHAEAIIALSAKREG